MTLVSTCAQIVTVAGQRFRFREGEWYSSAELLRTQFALDDTAYFELVEVLPGELGEAAADGPDGAAGGELVGQFGGFGGGGFIGGGFFGGGSGGGQGGGEPQIAEVYGHSPDTLYRLDPDTKAVTTVGDFQGCSGVIDIALDKDSKLLGASFGGLYAIDALTGEAEGRPHKAAAPITAASGRPRAAK